MADNQIKIEEPGTGNYSFYANAPLVVNWGGFIPKYVQDVNGRWVKADIAHTEPTTLTIDCLNISLTFENINYLWKWFEDRTLLTITDQATGTGMDDGAYYSVYTAYVMEMPGAVTSPEKMMPDSYQLVFAVQSVTVGVGT